MEGAIPLTWFLCSLLYHSEEMKWLDVGTVNIWVEHILENLLMRNCLKRNYVNAKLREWSLNITLTSLKRENVKTTKNLNIR